ncbi:MAG TPA: hypothetical protein PLF91_00155 [Mycolicibacterium fallax]|nr:hypothetical protein [Mycolicibacterium fallax]HSA39652.1 hypothetical protein [Mycobacterium sp.]
MTKKPSNPGVEAAEQAKAYNSPFAPRELVLDDGTVIEVPPHPNLRMLDDDALAAWDQLWFELEGYDHHEITLPERTVKDTEDGAEVVLPAETKQGGLKVPYRKTDPVSGEAVLLDPPYEVRVAQIALGDDYAVLRAGKVAGRRGAARHVWALWNAQSMDLTERQASDPKSVDSADGVEAVAPADRQ